VPMVILLGGRADPLLPTHRAQSHPIFSTSCRTLQGQWYTRELRRADQEADEGKSINVFEPSAAVVGGTIAVGLAVYAAHEAYQCLYPQEPAAEWMELRQRELIFGF
jgi:hypothetical protein